MSDKKDVKTGAVNAEVVKPETGVKESEQTALQQTGSMVDMIQAVAINPDVSVDKMERIMAMQERILDRQAKQEFASAMMSVQRDIAPIKKRLRNDHTDSSYANLDAVNRAVTPIYTVNGFSLTFGSTDSPIPECIRVICDVFHTGGYEKQYTYDSPIDNMGAKGSPTKTRAHGSGSAISYGRRYLVAMIFNLTLTDEDDDGNAATQMDVEVKKITEQQGLKLEGLLDENSVSKKAFLKHGNIKSVYDLPAAQLTGAIKWIKDQGASDE
ncbi:MAG: ERF family protein [Candidatus Sabulitectum sp.]|nr:ERF family protein [Candidatus Sabulitectum sp.]